MVVVEVSSSVLICVRLFAFTTQPEEERGRERERERERERGETNGRTDQKGQKTNGVEEKNKTRGTEKEGGIR